MLCYIMWCYTILCYIIFYYIVYVYVDVYDVYAHVYVYVYVCIYIYAEIALWKSLQTESPAWSLIYCWLSCLFKTIANQWIWRNADVIGSTVLSSLSENAQVIVPSSWWLCIPSHGQQLRLPTIYKSTSMVYKDLGYFGLSNNFSVLPNLRFLITVWVIAQFQKC